MKTKPALFAFFTASIVLLALLAGCEGPAGPAGKDGASLPPFNLEGFAPNIQCSTCHSTDLDTTYYVAARVYQWEHSMHATGGDIARNGTTCAGCHTTEGFVQRWNAGWTTQVVSEQLNPSPPGCFACHAPHARGNFSLRDSTPVTITSFIIGVPDAQFDYGKGNLCVRCHQTRTSSPMSPKPDPTKTAATDTLKITSSRWYPHYGVQGQMLKGTGGFEFTDFTYSGSSNHTSNTTIMQEGCPKCHMAEQSSGGAGVGGGHTMNIAYEGEGGTEAFVLAGCKDAGCHGTSITSPDIPGSSTGGIGAQTLIGMNLDTLQTLLLARGWIDTTGGSVTVVASSSRPLRAVPASRAGALYNFLFVEHDKSEGVHNTRYALELLRSSIRELRKP